MDAKNIDTFMEAAMVAEEEQLPDGWLEKAHVCTALQGLGAEQRKQALQGLPAWKERFAEARWKPIMEDLENIAQEDHLRLPGRLRQLEPVTPAGRPQPTSSSSAPIVPLVGQRSRPQALQRLNTASANLALARNITPRTPRARWDVLPSGPVTPLSPTPTGNAFAGGGFWEKLTPQPQTPLPQPAVALEPWSPIVPKYPEGKAAYDDVKRDVDRMALKICASRLSIHSNLSDSGYVPPSMVKPKDELHGAEFTLQSRELKLRTQIDTELPAKLQRFAHDEVAIHEQYSIKNTSELLDIDTWLQVDEKGMEITTILDAQRDLIRMNRNRRKSRELKLSAQAVQLAWAVKVLDDTEYMAEHHGDGSSTYSDEDQGYDYSNFMRSIKREVSSVSDLLSIEEENPIGEISSPRSMATTTISSERSQEASLSMRTSASPAKPNSLALRLRDASISSTDCALQRSSNATGKRRNLNVSTTLTEQEEDIPAPEISPEAKGFRHQGPSINDLTNWAHELKKMEERRAEMKANRNSASSSQYDMHPAFRFQQHGRKNSDESAESWVCKDAARYEKQAFESSADTRTPIGSIPAHHLEVPPTPTNPPQRSPIRSRPFYKYEQLTGPIPLPPASPTSYNRHAPTSHERLSNKASRQLRPSAPPERLPPSPFQHQHESTIPSLHNTVRRQQYMRSKSSSNLLHDEEEDWTKELKHMESREKIRQIGEREMFVERAHRKASGPGHDEVGYGDYMDDDEEEVGVAR